ncbi:unnamed protein product, partial [Discosporangium mesarthrocarpum]
SFHFRCSEKDGNLRIDSFMAKAFDWYKDEMAKDEDSGRHLYSLITNWIEDGNCAGDEGVGSIENCRRYKRYKLSEEKDFSSLFFPEKENLMQLLKRFEERTGKYAIKGYPHKLGLLLHGPPGTGKTSLIKALACHTQRSIVSVPLARISTNQELMDIVFDQSFSVVGEELPVKLGFKDVIFVMEDIDAASPIVLSRDTQRRCKRSRPGRARRLGFPRGGRAWVATRGKGGGRAGAG